MAGISKVTYGDEVLLDLTQDTVNPNVLLSGFTAHAANGDPIGGALVLGALAYLSSISYNSNYLTDKPTLGALAALNSISYNSNRLTDKPVLGDMAAMNLSDLKLNLNLKALAYLDSIDYNSSYLTNKPHLGALASRDFIEWSSSYLTNKPDFHKLAFQDFIDYESNQLINKPEFGDLAWQDSISYESDQITDKPRPLKDVIDDLCLIYPDMPKGIKLFGALGSNGFMYDDLLYYEDTGMHVQDKYSNWFSYIQNGEDGYSIRITVRDKLSDVVKPILGDLAYQNDIDYESDQLINKPEFGDLAWQDTISYESDQITDKPMPVNDLIDGLTEIYPDMPKGIQLFTSLAAGDFRINDLLYYADGGMHVHDGYMDWFTVVEYADETCIRITVRENLADFVKPILGDLAYQNEIDYESDQLINKPVFGDLAFQDLIDYETDQIINKPPTADVILNAILDIYPDIPIGIPFAVNAAAQGAFSFSEGVFSYVDGGIRFDPSNVLDISSDYISADNGVRFIFPPLQFISDVPDDDKVYARRHGEWVEITM